MVDRLAEIPMNSNPSSTGLASLTVALYKESLRRLKPLIYTKSHKTCYVAYTTM